MVRHDLRAVVEHTFMQFYPALKPVAEELWHIQ
jgi:hypothetical protein